MTPLKLKMGLMFTLILGIFSACETITYSTLECNPVIHVDTLTFVVDSVTYTPVLNGKPTKDPFLYNGCVTTYGGTPR